MKGTRGISPLIATILLIAFAVALGSLVYSYIVIIGGGTGARGCSNIVGLTSVTAMDGQPAYAIESGQIILNLRNSGYTDISSLAITYVGTNENIDIPSTPRGIATGRVQAFRQDYDRTTLGAIQTIVITPYYVRAQEETICNEATIEVAVQRR